ncbi:MAG: hypothetical protein NW217_15005 [Hyphomicrobiaceae bacterium]|nr:hypothetical protein [Hyphomicrobiaceae bacterium]
MAGDRPPSRVGGTFRESNGATRLGQSKRVWIMNLNWPLSRIAAFGLTLLSLAVGACALEVPALADAAEQSGDSASAIARKFSVDPTEETAAAKAPHESDPDGTAADASDPARSDLAAEREQEAQQLSERLRRAREERLREASRANPPEPGTSAPPADLSIQTADTSGRPSTRVTILLVMDVSNKGMRQWSKTADPMLCLHESCYLSRGTSVAAEKITRSEAFGPGVALGRRGLACRSKPACIFRDIDMETLEAKLQPVDLKILRHDRRQALPVHPDATCSILDGRLFCIDTVEGPDWRAWIVPEALAAAAGPQALERALTSSLGRPSVAGN